MRKEDYGKVKVGDKLIRIRKRHPEIVIVTGLDTDSFRPTKESGVIRHTFGLENLISMIPYSSEVHEKLVEEFNKIQNLDKGLHNQINKWNHLVSELQRQEMQ